MKITKSELKQMIREAIGAMALKADIAKSQKSRGFESSPTGTPAGDDVIIRAKAIDSLLSSPSIKTLVPNIQLPTRSDLDRAEALRDLADELESIHGDSDMGL